MSEVTFFYIVALLSLWCHISIWSLWKLMQMKVQRDIVTLRQLKRKVELHELLLTNMMYENTLIKHKHNQTIAQLQITDINIMLQLENLIQIQSQVLAGDICNLPRSLQLLILCFV